MSLTALLAALADGRFHSGAGIAAQLGVTRAAVWKAVRRLQTLGLPLDAVRGRGYRLHHPIEPLHAERVRAALPAEARPHVADIVVHLSLDSTSAWLRERATHGAPSGSVCLAESQGGGRGRAGRAWLSPLTGNLYLSVLWRFAHPPARLGTLSLALGVVAARVLAQAGIADVALKWPNDLLWHDHKVGGLLLEATAEAAGPCSVVVGFGLNLCLPVALRAQITQPSTDLMPIAPPLTARRNQLAAAFAGHFAAACARFPTTGFTPYAADWAQRDALAGREVAVHGADRVALGIAQGIDADGALQVQQDGALLRVASGEVSVRRV